MFTPVAPQSAAETAWRYREPTKSLAAISDVDLGWFGPEVEFANANLPIPSTPEEWEAFAEAQQDLLIDLDRELRQADANRTLTLIDAFDASMRDLAGRFGEQYGRRDSLGAQTFFQTAGLRIGMSPLRVAHLLDTAILLRDRLPRTWEAYLGGETTWRAVDLAASESDGLAEHLMPAFDGLARKIVVDAPASRMRGRLHHARERLQDGTAGERAKRTEAMRRVTIEHGRDSGASITATGPAIPLVGFDQALTKAAVAAKLHDEETRTVGQLRFDIMMDLLIEGIKQSADPAWDGLKVPARKGVVPSPIVTIPALAALGRTSEQARLQGYGPIAVETAKELAGSAKSFIRVLTDPFTGVRLAMDATTRIPPADMRRWVVVRDELCRFPGCNRPAHLCDLDHVQEWQDAGVTAIDNLVSLSRPHHRAKSAGLWQEELERDGSVGWENPWGDRFVDPPADPADPAPPELIEPDAPPGEAPEDDCPF